MEYCPFRFAGWLVAGRRGHSAKIRDPFCRVRSRLLAAGGASGTTIMDKQVPVGGAGWRERVDALRAQREEWRAIRAMAAQFGVDANAVEDVAQEVMIALHRTHSELDRRALVWGITKNKAAYYLRARSRREEKQTTVSVALPEPSNPSSEEWIVVCRERMALSRAIEELRSTEPQLHEVLELHLDELSADVIASKLGIPSGTVHGRLRRARIRLCEVVRRWSVTDANRKALARLRRGGPPRS